MHTYFIFTHTNKTKLMESYLSTSAALRETCPSQHAGTEVSVGTGYTHICANLHDNAYLEISG